jgi:hypothetical protein
MTVSVVWKRGLTLAKDPDSIEEYELDVSNKLGSDTISSVTVIDDDVTGTYISDTSGIITFRVSGGTLGSTGSVTLRTVTIGGVQFDRTIYFYIVTQ